MNRDTTIVQVAILFIIIAILGIAVFQKQQGTTVSNNDTKTVVVQPISEGGVVTNPSITSGTVIEQGGVITNSFTERANSHRTNLVKQYFAFIANKQYVDACRLMSNAKCADIRPGAVENFSIEFEKLKNGYEYVNIKDYGITAPSGKELVCVKYSYRYKNDPNPKLISEIVSFYTQTIDGVIRITDRVCEKKYKDGSGNRPCPIEPYVRFCEGKIK